MPATGNPGQPETGSEVVRVRAAEVTARAHSDTFRRELGLRDIVLTQIVYVVGATWVGTAAKLGHSQIAFWLAAMPRPPAWLRASAACGFGVTLLYVLLSILPIIDVTSWGSFAAKVSGVIVACNLLGYAIFVTGRRRAAAAA